MSSVDELCDLGFERYWVNQALELTNHNKDYALEWLLSDEFKLARQQFNEQKRKFQSKQTPQGLGLAMPQNLQQNNDNSNPLLVGHNKEPSLQQIDNCNNKKPPSKHVEQETMIEYNLNTPDLKPKHTLTDYKGIGIDHLLEGSDSDSDKSELQKNNLNSDNVALSNSLQPMDEIERTSSAQINMNDEPRASDEDMQNFLQKLKNQVNKKGDWLCHSCGVEVKGNLKECHMCNAVRPGETDWICSTCTFVNAQDISHCHMCLSEQPSDEPLSAKAKSGRVSLQPEHTWVCSACQYHNTKTNCCRMCGFVLGNDVTPHSPLQAQAVEQKEAAREEPAADEDDNVLLELARGNSKPKIKINEVGLAVNANSNVPKSPLTPSKHTSANSGDVFAGISGWELPDPPQKEIKVQNEVKSKKNGGGGGGMVMLSREKKKKQDDEEEEDEDEEEEEFEESSIEEVVGGDDVDVIPPNELVDAGDEDEDVQIFDDFEIPMMDEDQLAENADVINIQKPEVYASAPPAAAQIPAVVKAEVAEKKEPELSGMELLKSMYAADEKKNTKIKLKLRIGTVVDIYSSSRQDWVEGIIKEIKGDLICIVYGKHMKWLKKNSRQLRPKAQQVKEALQNQASEKVESAPPKPQNDDVLLAYGNDVPPAAFAEPDFQPPPPNDPPPAFAMDQNSDLMAPMQPDHFLTPKPKINEELNKSMESAADEFDYDVTFTTAVLGLELYPDRDGKNCIVGKCLSKTSKKFVDPSSIVVSVNDMWVSGMSYDMVRDAIKQAAKYPPLKMQFRVKMKDIGKKKGVGGGGGMNERGYLKVKVVAGVQLKHRASYCVVQVGNARLSTREVARNEHPEWQEMLTFKNFRPDQGKKAVVTVYDHSTILKDKKIGVTEYELPTLFNKLQRDTLELKSSKGKLSGVVILNTIIVHKSNSIRHLRKY